MELDNYFARTFAEKGRPLVDEGFLLEGYNEMQSFVYQKALMLLKPMDVTGHYVEGDIQMPYKRLNSKLFKEVFQWLNDNGYREIASTIGREYTKNKDFLEGRSNENTIELKPSSLYLNEYAIPSNAASSALENILSAGGTIGPELQLRLKNMGQGFYGKIE